MTARVASGKHAGKNWQERNAWPDMSQANKAKLNEIERAAAILFEPGQVVEIRVPGKYGSISGYFDDHEKLANAVKRLSDSDEHDGVYYTLNPCHEALLARSDKNELHHDVKITTSDAEIKRRRWLLIDFDPGRPSGVSATAEEMRAAKDLMIKVVKELRRLGWPVPVVALSGNGYHLLYRVDEQNDSETARLFQNVLKAIAEKFATVQVGIDTKVYNAARITKSYGSLAAKGVSTTDRPHRFSKILRVPRLVRVVSRVQLESVEAALLGAEKQQLPAARKNGATNSVVKMEAFLERGGLGIKSKIPTGDGGIKWILDACPFNPEHTNAPAVFLGPTGEFGFHCFHKSCENYKWKDFRDAVEKRTGEKFAFVREDFFIPYEATSAGIVWHKPTKNGEEVRLTNFNAYITADTLEDDGAESRRRFEIETTHGDRTERFEVPAGQFGAMNWVAENVGALAVIYPPPSNRDHARAAIQLLSREVQRRRVFTHIGWRRLKKGWVFLHASGAITAAGPQNNVSVRLPDILKNFKLPNPPAKDELKAAIRASLRILDVVPDAVGVPIYAGIWRPPLGKSDITLHLVGPTGAGKTELAVLAQQHYGREFNSRNLAAAWSGTANSLEVIAFAAKDALLVVDDFAPQGSLYDVARANRDADRLIRAQGNNAGRSRLRSDASLRPPKPPRGLILSTGEDIPRGHSTRARMFVCELTGDDLHWERLTRCQEEAQQGLYETAFAGYLQWLAARYDSIQALIHAKVIEFRARASKSPAHKRTPDTVAQLAVGHFFFLNFARSCGALSREEAAGYWRRFWTALGVAATHQRVHQGSEEPTSRFMDLVSSLLSNGAAHLADAEDGWAPEGARGPCLGWFDGDLILLEPNATFAAAQRLAREQGNPLTIGAKTLWKRMKDRGRLASHDEDRNLLTTPIVGQRRRVLAINAKKLPVHPELRAHRLRREYPEV
jgi:hypothetical protein